MERKIYSSLPSNYITLAQLQERWLNQRNQNNQSESQYNGKIQQSPNRNYLKPHLQVVAPSNGSVSKSRPQKQQYVVKIRNDSETHRRTAAVEWDDRRKSVTEIGDGDKTSCLDLDLDGKGKGKGKDSKSNKKIRKVNPEEREGSGEGSGTTAREKEKARMLSEVKENGGVKMNEVEERVRVLSIKSENGKQKGRLGKMNNGFVQQKKYGGEKKMVWVRKDEI